MPKDTLQYRRIYAQNQVSSRYLKQNHFAHTAFFKNP